ncbi:aromatic compound dioxygenase [Mycena metata]|uniref:Aromatic compound dioxygenase n=1 Tax=Mycena metata TaxID=1033252 RepID=A0AAD7MLG1_9AGAR|nr:aromatic compound dioxygenase [Mycena metata]KAJ7721610.1 aromatic compound dioxygenase [Mycena metata]
MRFTSFVSLAVLAGVAAAVPAASAPRDCSAEVARYNMERREARGLTKRTFYANMLNLTCVTAPETVLGDNYVENPPLITDITGGQPGVAFTVDIGVMNTATCKPLSDVTVELWGPNAVGEYGSFLRGAVQTASNGIAEFQTIFPGYTTGSANHLSILVHSSSSESSGVVHTGQLFFTDPWTNIIGQYTNYNLNKNSRMLNAADKNFAAANKNGFNSIIDIEDINDDWPEGIIGYITVGVNPTK